LQQHKENLMKNKNIVRIALVTAFLLLIPLVAMQFNTGVDWNLFDFIVAGTLLFGSGLAYELIARKGGNTAYRAAVGIAVAAALLLAWINLAVGIIGSENNPANLMYFGVIFVASIGAGIARFRARGMACALFVTAFAQALVPVIALVIGRSQLQSMHEPPGLVGVFALNAFFVMLFVVSALLFRHSAQDRSAETAEVK
jgi:cytochrome b